MAISEIKLDKATALLIQKFEESKRKNPRWSQRAFATRLGLSSGALSEILQGKRVLSTQLKKKIVDKLHLSPMEQSDFFEEELPLHLRAARLEYHRLSTDQFHLISDWWNFAILNLINTKDFKPSIRWISKRLNISESAAQESWERLFRLGYLIKNGKKIARGKPRLMTSDDFLNLSIQKSHLEDRKLIEKSLIEVPVDLRDHTSMTFVMNKKDIKKAKELIRSFQDQFSEQIESPMGDEVYKISMSLFPLTQINQNEDKI